MSNPFIPCPTCRTLGTLTHRVRFVRGTIDELRAQFPERSAEFDQTGIPVGATKVYAVGVPEFACEACGATFDGTEAPPRHGGRR